MKYLITAITILLFVGNAEAAKIRQPTCKTYAMVTGIYVTVCNKDLKKFKQLHPKTSNNDLTDVSSNRRYYRKLVHHRYVSVRHWRYTRHARLYRRGYQAPQRMVMNRGTADYSDRPRDCYGIQWCGCWLRHAFGIADTGLNLAMNWARMGSAASPEAANVVVWRHHVAKLHSVKSGPQGLMLYITSGNDAGAVRTRWFPARALGGAVAYRRV